MTVLAEDQKRFRANNQCDTSQSPYRDILAAGSFLYVRALCATEKLTEYFL